MKRNLQSISNNLELQHHFHQYFELLLGIEKERLLLAAATASQDHAIGLQRDIDERFAYLKGAVRMGRLLGLISSEEAKVKHDVLASHRVHLHSNFLGKFGEQANSPTNGSSLNGREHLKRLLKKVTTDHSLPPIDCRAG